MFVALYNFFRKHLLLCWFLFFATIGLWGFLAFHIKFGEDITSMLPDSKAIKAMNDVISHTRAGEEVVFLMSFKDSTTSSPDSLITASEDFYTQLHQRCGQWIDTINMQMGGGSEEALAEVFQNNIPLFLTERDFRQLDTLLQPARINSTLEANRKILMSPASVVYARMVAADPVGISKLVWGKLAALQFDPNYEIYNGYIFSKDGKHLTFF